MAASTPRTYTVLGGFLGAGKTTVLNHWLRNNQGPLAQRIAVLVNDFGSLNIDVNLIESKQGDTIALSNGCVCCQIGDDLSMALIRVLEQEPPFDAVMVEASGVSDPWRIAQMGLTDPSLVLDSVLVVLDVDTVMTHANNPLLADTLMRQIKAADQLILNRMDLVSPQQSDAVIAWLHTVAPRIPIWPCTHGEVPLQAMRNPTPTHAATAAHHHDSIDPCGHDAHDTHDTHDTHYTHGAHDEHHHTAQHSPVDHGHTFESWSAQPAHVFDRQALQSWLAVPPAGLLRLKGMVQIKAPQEAQGAQGAQGVQWVELQFAGRHSRLRKIAPPQQGSMLVAIGLSGYLPTPQLRRFFTSYPPL